MKFREDSRIWTGLEAVNGLTGGETENPNFSKKLAELACSLMPTREQSEVSNSSRLTCGGSLVVSGEMQWVNRLSRPTYADRSRVARTLSNLRGPRLTNLDMSLVKTFRITELLESAGVSSTPMRNGNGKASGNGAPDTTDDSDR